MRSIDNFMHPERILDKNNNKIQDEIHNEIFKNGRTAERKDIIKSIKELLKNVEEAGYENPVDNSYHNALLDVLKSLGVENGK